MFGFINCTKRLTAGNETRLILDQANLTFGEKEKIVVLASPGTGKSTLVKMLSKQDKPSAGSVKAPPSMSWPHGFAGFFHPVMTGEQNIRTLSAMLQIEVERVTAFAFHFSELGDQYYRPVQEYSGGMRARLAVAFSMGVTFPFYIADDSIGGGDKAFRAKCDAMMDRNLRDAGLFFATSNTRLAERFGERFAIIHDRKLVECHTVKEAQSVLEEIGEEDELFSTLLAGLKHA